MFCKRISATLLLERRSSITLLMKNIWERLLLKISTSVTNSEAVDQSSSVKKVFLEISQNSQKYICARVSYLIKLQAWDKCFLVNFVKFPRKPFFIEHLWWLLLQIYLRKGANSDFFYSFKSFGILNFTMLEWFCHLTCFSTVYLILWCCFFSCTSMIFLS